MKKFNQGILLSSLGSFWWGVIGVVYFRSLSFVGPEELVIHRCLWTTIFLLITSFFLFKFEKIKNVFKSKKKFLILLMSSILILTNWSVWIYAVTTNQIINASFGYFIMPIMSVFFGYLFFKENLNFKIILSIILVIISIFYMLYEFKSIPWIGLTVAISWSLYNVCRKLILVDTDIGLLVESFFIFPFALLALLYLFTLGTNNFSTDNISLMFLLILAGPITVIPLFLYVKGVELSGLGPTGMIFYITPTFQFLLGYFYYDEIFSFEKFISFIIIWIAVLIYLNNLYEKN
jgi:chloramphenicol-sensitive protein RarD